MKEKCEIIQDLLINYEEGILNEESNKLVEEHLKNCKRCKNYLNEIKKEKDKDNKTTKKEIDFLKKYKRNSTIKAIISPIVVIILICIIYYFSKFSIFNDLNNKYLQTLDNTENFYCERYMASHGEILKEKIWYKDGKYKIESDVLGVTYGDINEKYEIQLDEDTKIATKTTSYFIRKEDLLQSSNPICKEIGKSIAKFGIPFYWEISEQSKDIGKMYYKIQSKDESDSELWVDKETGLPIMKKGYSYSVEYFENTHIEKNRYEDITEYKYEFDCVEDTEVEVADLSKYTIEEKDFQNYIEQLKEQNN